MNCFSHKFFTALCFDQDFELADACVLPDEDENQNGYSCHFYNPVTGKCYLGTEDSAKNRFIWHLCNYLMTKKKEELGRAIHFLEDMCTPVHTQYEDASDAVIQLKKHVEFEKRLDDSLEKGLISKDVLRFKSISEILECCPCNSSEIYYQLSKSEVSNKELEEVYGLTVSALKALKELLVGIVGKSFVVGGEKINVVFEKGVMLPSCLNSNFLLRYNGVDNVKVYKRKGKFYNYNVVGNIFD